MFSSYCCLKVSNSGESLLFILPGDEENKGERMGLSGRRISHRTKVSSDISRLHFQMCSKIMCNIFGGESI